jgi:hypothetical protein
MSPSASFRKTFLRVRIALYAAILALLGFLLLRYDLLRLPEQGCSPLSGIAPGARLVVERHPRKVAPGDALLYRSPAGELLLGRVVEPPASVSAEAHAACAAGSLWLVSEDRACSTKDSGEFGPIAPSAVEGRIRGVLPW